MSGHKLCKLSKQQETTWAKLHRRLIGLDFNYEELFSKDVSSFIADNAKATSSSIGYFIAPLLTTVNYLVSQRSLLNISTHSIPLNSYMIFGGPPSSGKTQAIERTVNEPIQNIISDNDENDFRIKKISSSGLTKYLSEKEQGYVVSSEIYDILTKLLKSDEENATGDSQLLCELFSGETVTLTYATEKCRVIKKNTPFSIIGSTQLPMLTKIVCRLDQGHVLLDRFSINVPNCIRPTPDETAISIERLKAIPNSMSDIIYLINMLQHPTQYKFNNEAQALLKELNTEFINDLNQAILAGNVPPKTKKIDIAVKHAVGVHVFEQVATPLIQGQQPECPIQQEISKDTLQKAIKYTEFMETQKEILLQVIMLI